MTKKEIWTKNTTGWDASSTTNAASHRILSNLTGKRSLAFFSFFPLYHLYKLFHQIINISFENEKNGRRSLSAFMWSQIKPISLIYRLLYCNMGYIFILPKDVHRDIWGVMYKMGLGHLLIMGKVIHCMLPNHKPLIWDWLM